MLTLDAAEHLLEGAAADWRGAHPSRARAFFVAIHGRGADAASILGLADALAQPDICFLAPSAEGRSWYPHPFTAPTEMNEPHLSRSLARMAGVLDAIEAAGVPPAKIGLIGFSQGACLTLETAIRRPRPHGAIIAFSGGYIGPIGQPRVPAGNLAGASVFLGCSDVDPHIPLARVKETDALMRAMGATVDMRIYPGLGHGVNDDEVAAARTLAVRMFDAGS